MLQDSMRYATVQHMDVCCKPCKKLGHINSRQQRTTQISITGTELFSLPNVYRLFQPYTQYVLACT